MSDYQCTCCWRIVGETEWDGLYTACHDCAFEHSLEHWPCDHGAARRCQHARMTPEVFDQTAGVSCPDCRLQAWCWAEKHVSEALWNLACKNDADANPCKQSRVDVCALCDERIA